MNIDSPNLLGGKGEPRNQGQVGTCQPSQPHGSPAGTNGSYVELPTSKSSVISTSIISLDDTTHGGVSLINTFAS